LTQYQADDKNRIKRQKTDSAIRLALEGKWEDAVNVNQELLSIFPDDSETLNRLGKAFLELRRFAEAKEAYERALKIDPGNSIAQKNLKRLAEAIAAAAKTAAKGGPVKPVVAREKAAANPGAFIEETGKTGVTSLVNLSESVILAKLTAGDVVYLDVDSKQQVLRVKNEDGEVLGQIEPKLALRLIRFLGGGNRYAVAVTSVTEKQLTLIIREIYQHPSQRGRLSFPAKTVAAGYRPYTKDTVLRYGLEDEDEGSDDNDSDDGDADDGDEEGDMSDDFVEEPEADEM